MKKNYLIFILVFSFLFFSLPASLFAITFIPQPMEEGGVLTTLTCSNSENVIFFFISPPNDTDPADDICVCSPLEECNSTVTAWPVGDWKALETTDYENSMVLNYSEFKASEYYVAGSETNFSVVLTSPEAPTGALFNFPSDFASGTLAYIGGMITDLATPIYILIGIILGMWLIDYLFSLFARKRE